MNLNKAEGFVILILGRNPDRARSVSDIRRDAKAYGVDLDNLAQAYDSLEYREDTDKNPTGLIRQVTMGQSGNFGFILEIRGRQAFAVLGRRMARKLREEG